MGIRLGTMGAVALLGAGTAEAGPALDENKPETAAGESADPVADATKPVVSDTTYGVALRIRNVRVPSGLIELFVERAAGGASNLGLGLELSRRKGSTELQIGLEYERITVGEGVWINRDEPVPAYEADYVLSPDRAPDNDKLGWFTLEFTFLNHAEIAKKVAFRYGGGLGLGIITGGLYRFDVQCAGTATNANPEPGCRPSSIAGGQGTATGPAVKYDLPPVFPVVNAIIGFQFRPVDKVVINVEGGIRTLPFFGTSVGYVF